MQQQQQQQQQQQPPCPTTITIANTSNDTSFLLKIRLKSQQPTTSLSFLHFLFRW
jgi:hypothetical protein